jgi:RNA polymerase sigma factor (sigma-70 family)
MSGKMPENPDASPTGTLEDCLARLAAGDLSARDRIVALCHTRLRRLASRMLDRFPKVRRWDETDDVLQNASLRLHRALGAVPPDSLRAVLALAATQLHRELIDLARRYAGPWSHASHHDTNLIRGHTAGEFHVDRAVDPAPALDRWSLFHEAIAGLSAEDRETFQLVWYLGADQKSIARLLDCSERTVRQRWRSARERIRAALDGRPPE